jgi:hypothetical protein
MTKQGRNLQIRDKTDRKEGKKQQRKKTLRIMI